MTDLIKSVLPKVQYWYCMDRFGHYFFGEKPEFDQDIQLYYPSESENHLLMLSEIPNFNYESLPEFEIGDEPVEVTFTYFIEYNE